MNRAIAYYRVSTQFQADTGFSLAGQRTMVRGYVEERGLDLIAEHEEAESGYRLTKFENRPVLQAALKECRRLKATLVIAALDRLARNVVFIASLIETKIAFVALDIPDATPFTIHIYAAIAEEESRQKGVLIRASRAMAKARGLPVNQGSEMGRRRAQERALAHRAILDEIRAQGIVSPYGIAREMTRRRVPCGNYPGWSTNRVERMLIFLGYFKRPATRWEYHDVVAAEARAVKLRPVIAAGRARGEPMSKIAIELNKLGSRTARGLPWTDRRPWNFVLAQERRRPRPIT